MFDNAARYVPAFALAAGAALTGVIGTPHPTPLRAPLASTLPATFMGAPSKDIAIDKDEVEKSGVSDYINRLYLLSPDQPAALYVGYHATQQGDKRMHSPTLCLPGSGWTPVGEGIVNVPVNGKPVAVNRFILQSQAQKILVYYWFQGRGRLTTGQGTLKLNAMRDALLTHRDEEALVRIIVPIPADSAQKQTLANTGLPPDSVAARLASAVIEPLNRALPPAP